MYNKCQNLVIGFKKYKCKRTNQCINLSECNSCPHRERKPIETNKCTIKNKNSLKGSKTPLKKKSSKLAKLEKERYSILTNDLKTCIECGKTNCEINLHEIFYGTGKRQISIKYGAVIPLCTISCHNQYKSIGIHFDKQMCVKWHKKGQLECMKYYNINKEEFKDIFGKNYLD